MKELRYTLLSDGSSDRAVMPILTWLLRQHRVTRPIQPEWADLRLLPQVPRGLSDRIEWTVRLYPCDLLFVHRDAEAESPETRVREIVGALADTDAWGRELAVCVVPVRMTEAWLLLDEAALRRAAGNPSGREALSLPAVRDLEQLPDPKNVLYDLLRAASGLRGRRRRRFPASLRAQRITELMDSFTCLRALPAFRALETEVRRVFGEQKWAR